MTRRSRQIGSRSHHCHRVAVTALIGVPHNGCRHILSTMLGMHVSNPIDSSQRSYQPSAMMCLLPTGFSTPGYRYWDQLWAQVRLILCGLHLRC